MNLPLYTESAHRVRPHIPSNQRGPHPLIALFLHQQQVARIQQIMRSQKVIKHMGQNIYIGQDFARSTKQFRSRLPCFRPQLKKVQARCSLISPATMLVTLGERAWSFTKPDELQSFLQEHQTTAMDTTRAETREMGESYPNDPHNFRRDCWPHQGRTGRSAPGRPK